MTQHQAVLYREALTELAIKPNGIYVDCTFGRGGHSTGLLAQLGSDGRLLAIDRDPEAIQCQTAQTLLADDRFRLHHGSFATLAAIIKHYGYSDGIDGILLDLGVSSPQLDTAERGFSFMRNGPLDMRMDTSQGLTAAEYLATVDEAQLIKVLFEYGEERFARRIARAIVEQRQTEAITTTQQLARLIENSVPFRDKHKHPATRSFQAIRIEINQELAQIDSALQQAAQALNPGGRLVVIAFHSLEDRMVKRFFRDQSGRSTNPGKLPVKEHDIAQGPLKTVSKAIRAQADELHANPRARSAVMRVAEKR
jgi:16S rRNA (cytosine1402-N4)-methyltransferase